MNIQLSVMVWTVICFVLLMIILKKLLFEPVLQVLDSRNEKLLKAREKKSDIEKAIRENEEKLAVLKAQDIKERKQEAKRKLQQIQSDGKKEIENAQRQCLADIRKYRESISGEYDEIVQTVAPEMETAAAIFAKNVISHRV